MEVILPINGNKIASPLKDDIARLFLFFPLIGSEHWGFNFIIHSSNFDPTEPRDGIHLKSHNEQVRDSESTNRKIIQGASEMVFEFVKKFSHLIYSPISLARINFKANSEKLLLNEYFKELKVQWVNKFQNFPLVETEKKKERANPSEVYFFHNDLLQNDDSFDSIFNLIYKFWQNIPKKELITEWTKIIDEWSTGFTEPLESIKLITIKDLVVKIQESENLSAFADQADLQIFYSYLLNQEKGNFFNDYKLLPNIKGEFRKLADLNSSIDLPDVLIAIADTILPDIPKRLVHDDFKFKIEFTPYTRKNYTTEINDQITKILSQATTSNLLNDPSILPMLLDYCKIAPSTESSSVPSKMIKLICAYYGHRDALIPIPEIKDDSLDVRSTQKRILRLFLNDISRKDSKWVTDNISFLEDVISTGATYYDYEDLFQTLSVFPNQLNELIEQRHLSIDDDIPEEIKDLYDRVLNPDYPIRSNLIHDNFKGYLKDGKKRTVLSLTQRIENIFFEEHQNISINNHPFKKEILTIIEKLKASDDVYANYFRLIYSRRSEILVGLADGDDTFSILSLESEKIKKLAKLGQNPNLEKIIKLGEEALLNEKQENANFQHKKAIGTHLEKILREKLSNIFAEEIELKSKQDGQDIVVTVKGEIVYFIEVKSRWNVNSSIKMSKNQTIQADKQKDNYALCSIDMTKYEGTDRYDIQDIDKIRHCIKFNQRIGYEVSHLIEVLSQTNEIDSVHLDGEYRTLIPMKIIDRGTSLKNFEDNLITFINE